MTNHYFTEQPKSAHENIHFTFALKGKTLQFTTDAGVFSKTTVDFGSRLLITTFAESQLPEGPLLDVGCGYGPIGLALAASSERTVEMIDINQRALDLAKQNAHQNQIVNVDIHFSHLYEDVHARAYAGILSNPPIRAGKKVVHQILTQAYDLLLPQGALTIVIQKKQGAKSAEKKMQEIFGNVNTLQREKGYLILQSTKE